jgi:digeranylgeranylglycerophospholipid reductase
VAARQAALGGASTLLIEKKDEVGVPVNCGEFLPAPEMLQRMFPACTGLPELFELPARCISVEVRTMCIVTPAGRRLEFDFPGMSLWRAKFDQHLAKLAVEAGAVLRTGHKVRAVDSTGIETDEGHIRARVIIGADGAMSVVRRALEIPDPVLNPYVQYTIPGDYGDVIEIYLGSRTPGGHAWLIPKKKGANVGLGGMRSSRRSLTRALDNFVFDLGIHDRPMLETGGVVPVSGPLETTVHEGVLLAGDAAGFSLAVSGTGIPTAVISGRAAGEAAAAFLKKKGVLSDYDRRWTKELLPTMERFLRLKRWARRFTWSDFMTELALLFVGARGVKRAIIAPPKKK